MIHDKSKLDGQGKLTPSQKGAVAKWKLWAKQAQGVSFPDEGLPYPSL